MQVGIVAQRGNERAKKLAVGIAEELNSDIAVRVDENTVSETDSPIESASVEDMAGDSLVVSIGGDGTFLFVARQVGATPVMGVNLGEVGFLNAVSPDSALGRIRTEIEHLRESGEPQYREVPRIEAHGAKLDLAPGLNEIVVQGQQRGPGQGIDLDVRIGNSTYFESHADGVVVATQTGSTAYNLSEGGPIVHPSASGLVVTPMCATEQVPSLLVDVNQTIQIGTSGKQEAIVASDGSERQRVETPATIEVSLASEPAQIAGPRSDFFEALEKIG